MTKEREAEIVRVIGPDYKPLDVPPAWRDKEDIEKVNAELAGTEPTMDQFEEMSFYDGIVFGEPPEEDEQE